MNLRRPSKMLAIAERVKLHIYAAHRPIRRLQRDVIDIERFEHPDAFTARLRLLTASPPLSSASADVLDAVIGICEERLFDEPYLLLLDSMALLGPIAAAEALVLLSGDSHMTEELKSIVNAIEAVCERYPTIFFIEARTLLTRHGSVKR
ncbi:hypothetical protein [Caballeronia glathei]|nr:hypothetical protein [Caballeronia glathei]